MGGRLLAAPPVATTAASRRYRIDGNLIPPIDPDHPLPDMIAIQVRSAKLTALEHTAGGSDSMTGKETAEELRVFGRGIALNPKLFLEVRSRWQC